jgi:hypothetical protein
MSHRPRWWRWSSAVYLERRHAGTSLRGSASWRASFEWGSYNFADGSAVLPTWYLQRGQGEPASLEAVGIELDDLRRWLERVADSVTAKAVLWHYRPDTMPLSMGTVLAPRVTR